MLNASDAVSRSGVTKRRNGPESAPRAHREADNLNAAASAASEQKEEFAVGHVYRPSRAMLLR